MKKISSGNTFFLKRILPLIFFVIPVVLMVSMLTVKTSKPVPLVALLAPCLVTLIGFVVVRQLVMDLADEVLDGGDFLLVRNRGQEERIPLSNIMNVSLSANVNPPRITLRLVRPGKFGDEIAFTPLREFSLKPFARNRIADDLMVRVDQARTKRAR